MDWNDINGRFDRENRFLFAIYKDKWFDDFLDKWLWQVFAFISTFQYQIKENYVSKMLLFEVFFVAIGTWSCGAQMLPDFWNLNGKNRKSAGQERRLNFEIVYSDERQSHCIKFNKFLHLKLLNSQKSIEHQLSNRWYLNKMCTLNMNKEKVELTRLLNEGI